jgi:hypothetical protein
VLPPFILKKKTKRAEEISVKLLKKIFGIAINKSGLGQFKKRHFNFEKAV